MASHLNEQPEKDGCNLHITGDDLWPALLLTLCFLGKPFVLRKLYLSLHICYYQQVVYAYARMLTLDWLFFDMWSFSPKLYISNDCGQP